MKRTFACTVCGTKFVHKKPETLVGKLGIMTETETWTWTETGNRDRDRDRDRDTDRDLAILGAAHSTRASHV